MTIRAVYPIAATLHQLHCLLLHQKAKSLKQKSSNGRKVQSLIPRSLRLTHQEEGPDSNLLIKDTRKVYTGKRVKGGKEKAERHYVPTLLTNPIAGTRIGAPRFERKDYGSESQPRSSHCVANSLIQKSYSEQLLALSKGFRDIPNPLRLLTIDVVFVDDTKIESYVVFLTTKCRVDMLSQQGKSVPLFRGIERVTIS